MRQSRPFLTFAILTVIQMMICNYINITPYVTISILPVAILCLPIQKRTIGIMIPAFLAGLVVDYLSDGILGLNALALVPVAFFRNIIISVVFGPGLFARKEDMSIYKHGLLKISSASILALSIFLIIYIAADGAGTRPFTFNLLRFGCSIVASYLISFPVVLIFSNKSKN